jgi:positive regulator of sigma E activity
MKQECSTRSRLFTVENALGLPLAVGQLVEVGVSSRAAAFQALSALFPLAAGFVAAFALAGMLSPSVGENARAASGALGLFLTGFVMYAFRKRFPAKTSPQILRVLV